MSRARTGSVRFRRGKYVAELAGEHLGTFSTEAEAWEAIDAGLLFDKGNAPDSIRVFGETFFARRAKSGVRGVDKERSLWDRHVLGATLADWPMRRVQPRHVDELLHDLLDVEAVHVTTVRGEKRTTPLGRKLSIQMIKHTRRLLLECFKLAALQGKVSANPVREVPLPKRDEVIEDEDAAAYMEPAEFDRLFAAIDAWEPPPKASDKSRKKHVGRKLFYRTVYSVALYQGLRQAELFGLRWQDLDLDGSQPSLRVRNSTRGALKSRDSRRTIPIQEPARVALRAWKNRDGVTRATGPVFASTRGGHYAPGYSASWEDQVSTANAVRKGWRTRARIRENVTFHALRHTCLTYLAHGIRGYPKLEPIDLKNFAGHADLKTTMRYVHAVIDALHEAVRPLGRKKIDTP